MACFALLCLALLLPSSYQTFMKHSALSPTFVFVRPQMGENIGAAARAMLNFNLTRMRVVAPRDGWPNSRAVAMASGAGRLLEDAGPYSDVRQAIGDCDYVFATTARGRDLVKPVLTPEESMARAQSLGAEGKRVAFLFGPERAGLQNEDLACANACVTVPVNPDFPSLNLAQCALLLGYEWHRQGAQAPLEAQSLAHVDFATKIEVEKLADHFERQLDAAGFFRPEEKAAHMKLNLRNMWGRLPLTRAETQTFHGMLRQIAWKLNDILGRDPSA